MCHRTPRILFCEEHCEAWDISHLSPTFCKLYAQTAVLSGKVFLQKRCALKLSVALRRLQREQKLAKLTDFLDQRKHGRSSARARRRPDMPDHHRRDPLCQLRCREGYEAFDGP